MTPFWALVRKDLMLFIRDKRAVIMSFVAPILIGSFMGFVFGRMGNADQISKIAVAVVDEDAGKISQSIVAKLSGDAALDVQIMDRASAATAVRSGKISVATIVPHGFGDSASRAFFRRDLPKPELEILYDPSRGTERMMIEGLLTGRVMEAVSAEAFNGTSGAAALEDAIKDLGSSALPSNTLMTGLKTILDGIRTLPQASDTAGSSGFGGMTVPFTTKAQAATARKAQDWGGVAHSFSGMGVQFILFMGIEAGVALLLQRQRGLWKRLRCAPVSRGVLLGSRAVSSAICAFSILVTMFVFARIAFGVRIDGSYAGFALVALAFALMTAAFGLLVASLGKTPEATRPIAVLATLVMVMLGGSWIPAFLFPPWLQTVTFAMPTRWALEGLDSMTFRGLGFEAALLPAGVVAGFAVTFATIAWFRFQWEVD